MVGRVVSYVWLTVVVVVVVVVGAAISGERGLCSNEGSVSVLESFEVVDRSGRQGGVICVASCSSSNLSGLTETDSTPPPPQWSPLTITTIVTQPSFTGCWNVIKSRFAHTIPDPREFPLSLSPIYLARAPLTKDDVSVELSKSGGDSSNNGGGGGDVIRLAIRPEVYQRHFVYANLWDAVKDTQVCCVGWYR